MPQPLIRLLDHWPRPLQVQHVVAYLLITGSAIGQNYLQAPPSLMILPLVQIVHPSGYFEFPIQSPHSLKWFDVETMQSFEKPYLISLYALGVMSVDPFWISRPHRLGYYLLLVRLID